MPHQHPIVDRKIEFGIFRALLDNSKNKSESILLLKNESGQGKSKLLRLYETHCRENKIPVSRVDFKGGSLTPLDIIRTVHADFRPFYELQRCSNLLSNKLSPPSIHITNNTSIGQAQYSIQNTFQSTGTTIEEQRARWEAGAQAVLDDLFDLTKNGQRYFVILFDTYEQASDEAQKWLANHILRMSTPQRLSSLLIVIAGKEIPHPTSEWEHCYQTINLEPLKLEDWLEYASLVIGDFHPEYIERIYAHYKNSPLQMATVINALAPVGDTSNASR